MAASGEFADVIALDFFDGTLPDNATILMENLTQEEKEEMVQIVQQLDSVNSWEVINFASQEDAALAAVSRHKSVSAEELDHLASKNSTESTHYQTNWSVRVIKGNIFTVFMLF